NNDLHPRSPRRANQPKNVIAGHLPPFIPEHAPTDGARRQRFLDLRPYANMKLTEDLGRRGNNLASLPTGEQTLAGVRFHIGEGLTLLKGSGLPRPEKVEGIKVGATFSRLYTLHATHWAPGADALTGFYRARYVDSSQQTIPIVYGKDVSNWWHVPGCS